MLKHSEKFDYREMLKGYDFSSCDMKIFKEEFEGENKRKRIEMFETANNIFTIYA
ncbi:hypothetical protein [Clostridium sp. LP20]|uniref:hypothetical protein n=1 Tax=Clostridium sp. LP20 TaxID=3418665 RepID=UPI003EE5E3CB